MKKVLMIAGSLRKNSFNHQLGSFIGDMMGEDVSVNFLEYAYLPFTNQDIEFPVPESVAGVRKAVQEADGIWIVSPEYNYQIPGVLKNLLDWLSRPVDPNDRKSGSAVKGKTVTISSAAGKSAGAGVRKNLNSLLTAMSMNVVGGIGTGIVLDGDAFKTNVLNVPDCSKEELKAQVESFLAAI